MTLLKKIGCTLMLILSLAGAASAEERALLTVNFSPSRFSLNPQYGFTTSEAQIYTALYEGLVAYHPATLLPQPALAESWEIDEEGTRYTFRLREGIKWSNGAPITAEQFRRSWLKLLSPEVGADYASLLDVIPGAEAYRSGRGPAEEVAIRALDSRTFQVELSRKVPYFLQILCHYSFVPVPPELLDKPDWWQEERIPVSGPFRFAETAGRSKLVLEKNPLYWDKDTVQLDELNIQFSDDPEELMDQFRLYQVDWIVSGWNGASLDPQTLEISPLFATTYFYFNNKEEAWRDPRVRRGLTLLLPWEKIRGREYLPSSRLIPAIPGYPDVKGIEGASVAQGLALLEEAGYPRGEGLPPIRIRVPYRDSEVLRLIQESWGDQLETEVVIDEVPFPAYFSSLKEGGYALGQITWIGDYADPMTFLQMWQRGSSLNDAEYESEEYDRLLNETDGENRLERMAQAEQLLLESAQVLPISHSPALNLIDLRFIGGWYHNVLDIHPFKYIRFLNEFVIPGTI